MGSGSRGFPRRVIFSALKRKLATNKDANFVLLLRPFLVLELEETDSRLRVSSPLTSRLLECHGYDIIFITQNRAISLYLVHGVFRADPDPDPVWVNRIAR